MPDLHIQAQTLDRYTHSDGVSNILWGNYLLTVYGVPTIVDVWISIYFLNKRSLT